MMRSYVALFFVLVPITTSVPFRNCSCSTATTETPKPLGTSNGTCYIYVDQPSTWSAAKSACASQGGHLISGLTSEISYMLGRWLPEGVYWTGGMFDALWMWDNALALNIDDFSQGNILSEASLVIARFSGHALESL